MVVVDEGRKMIVVVEEEEEEEEEEERNLGTKHKRMTHYHCIMNISTNMKVVPIMKKVPIKSRQGWFHTSKTKQP
eukprot:9568129-Ditylum_brightwellii.AAC.1